VKPAGYVLAGGASRRMGRDKVLMPWGGTTLLERALRALDAVCAETAIVGCREDLAAYGRVIPDALIDAGPLAGLVTALQQSQSEWNLILAVDLPGIGPEELRELMDAQHAAGRLAVIAEDEQGRLQPLCGMYRRSLAGPLREELARGERAVIQGVQTVCGMGLARVRLATGRLRNLNTAEDVAAWNFGG